MFGNHHAPPAAPYYQPQYPAYYPPPQQPVAPVQFGQMDPRGPMQPYQYPQQPNVMQPPNMPMQQPTPRSWFRITKDEVRNLANDQPILTISRQSAYGIPKELSSKSSVTLTRPDGTLLGTCRFHSLSSSDIDFSVNGHSSKLSDQYMMGDKFTFKPISRGAVTTMGSSGEKWCWKLKGHSKAVLTTKTGGDVLAKIENGMFVFERPGMSHAECDEILVTAVAVYLKGNRNKKDGEVAEGVFEVVGGLTG